MLDFSLEQDIACSIRYPKTAAAEIQRELQPIELGKSETMRTGSDGIIITCGTPLEAALAAAEELASLGIDVGVVNARFVKPLDKEMIRNAVENTGFVVTVEEAMLQGGFGSAVLEAANELGIDSRKIHRIGIPDEFVQHADRHEVLAELKLDATGIAATCRQIAAQLNVETT
jgi:1-deoxy-D-xylulose-5-phosphate synthase